MKPMECITTKFGSVDTRILVNGDERQYPAGIAHFLEHKVFEDEKWSRLF